MYFHVFFGICSSFCGVFIRAFWERVCQSCNIYMLFSFYFGALSLSISLYISIYLPTSNLPTNLSVRSYLSKFIKSSLISRNSTIYQSRLSWNSDSKKSFIRTLLGCVNIYCHQKLLSKIHKVYFLSLCFKWPLQSFLSATLWKLSTNTH